MPKSAKISKIFAFLQRALFSLFLWQNLRYWPTWRIPNFGLVWKTFKKSLKFLSWKSHDFLNLQNMLILHRISKGKIPRKSMENQVFQNFLKIDLLRICSLTFLDMVLGNRFWGIVSSCKSICGTSYILNSMMQILFY